MHNNSIYFNLIEINRIQSPFFPRYIMMIRYIIYFGLKNKKKRFSISFNSKSEMYK